jgi:DNA repair photolyase
MPEPRGRGAASNPHNRFEPLAYEDLPPEADEWPDPEEEPAPRLETRLYRDASRSIFSHNQSPDVPFDTSLNPYRGCEHACSYCFARPTHEYLGWSAGLDFESRILVKERAPELVREELSSPRWQPRVIAIGGVTDAYQPAERRLGITRRCLEVFAEFRNPIAIVTKSALVLRDADLLRELAAAKAAAVYVSLTTLDRRLARRMEPRAAAPRLRLEAVAALARAGIPVGVMVAPVIPGLNDAEIPALVEAAARAGAGGARHILLRLPHGLKQLFEDWLERHYPERREKVLGRLRAARGGRLNDPHFHSRMRGSGHYAEQIHALFGLSCRRAGIPERGFELSTAAFRRPTGPQLALFAQP